MKRIIILSLILLLGCSTEETIVDSDQIGEVYVELRKENEKSTLHTSYKDHHNSIDITELSPWKVELCYIDGVLSVAIGVEVQSPLDPVDEKRPFIYNLDPIEGRLKPRLRISRLHNPMVDFEMVEIGDEGSYNLMSIERTRDNLYTLNLYEIRGYGGDLIYSSPATKDKPKLNIDEILNIYDLEGGQYEKKIY